MAAAREWTPSLTTADPLDGLLRVPTADSPGLDPDPDSPDSGPAMGFDGAELLKDVFDSIAHHGRVTLDQLPFLLVGAEVPASGPDIEEAIEQVLPGAEEADSPLDFQQVRLVYQHLLNSAAAAHPAASPAVEPPPPPGLGPSLVSRLARWAGALRRRGAGQTAYEKHMRPTTRLLLIILCASCFICVAIVVVAIVLIWNFSIDNVMGHMKRDVDLMWTGMNLFAWQKPVELNAENSRQLASLVSILMSELGYKGSMDTLKGTLDFEAQLMAGVLDGWFEHEARYVVDTSRLILGGWLDVMSQYENASTATLIALVDALNPSLPPGHEVLLGCQNATSGNLTLVTSPRFVGQALPPTPLRAAAVAPPPPPPVAPPPPPLSNSGTDSDAMAPMKLAFSGQIGTLFGVDGRSLPVVAGYAFLPHVGVAVEYKVDLPVLRGTFQTPATQLVNAATLFALQMREAGGHSSYVEMTLAAVSNDWIQILSDVTNCDAACLVTADVSGSPAALAARNQSGVAEALDFAGNRVMAAYVPLLRSGLGLSTSMVMWDTLQDILPAFANAAEAANQNFNDTKEVQFATFDNSTIAGPDGANMTRLELQFWGSPKFPAGCGNHSCVVNATTCPYVQLASVQCTAGNTESQDYRGSSVFVGFACAADINGVVTVKVDKSQLKAEGVALARTIAEYQNGVQFRDSSTEVLLARKKPGVVVPKDMRDFTRILPLKHWKECPDHICGVSPHLVSALRGETGVVVGPDYRGVRVVGAYTYVAALDLALAINVEAAEAEAASVDAAVRLAGCALAAVVVGMGFLYVWTNRLLRSMDKAWDEGKRAIEMEKEAFGAVIRAMYPSPVAKRLLAGEAHIVYNVPNVTVFFSDIYEFTTASNVISAEELMQFMGYTFGVMDAAAEHFHVHKVKTIGDAYLAVAGLPGCSSLTGTTCLDTLLFASSCVQLFSQRYLHPEGGGILGTVHQTLFGKPPPSQGGGEEAGPVQRRKPSGVVFRNPALPEAPVDPPGPSPGQCVMRYGVATGPVTAGILPGKVPLFDLWGKTVNLASRMESTGQPGRIQVSEGVHGALLKVKGHPFAFDRRHRVCCKGFGHVFAYFLASTSVPPPEELLTLLGIEPNLGQFNFDGGSPSPGSVAAHTVGSSASRQSSSASDDFRRPAAALVR